MVAAELTPSPSRWPSLSRWLPAGLPGAWLGAYTAVWIATFGFAALVAVAGPRLAHPVRQLLGLSLTPDRNAAPQLGHVLVLAAHNIPIVAWPLLLGVMGADRHRVGRRLADIVVLACILVNVVPVGVALGAYGTPLLPYVPQLPLEWAGLALGASAWVVQRHRALTVRDGLAWFALIVGVLLCAAVVETVAVPHR
jgi:hypothetical protein